MAKGTDDASAVAGTTQSGLKGTAQVGEPFLYTNTALSQLVDKIAVIAALTCLLALISLAFFPATTASCIHSSFSKYLTCSDAMAWSSCPGQPWRFANKRPGAAHLLDGVAGWPLRAAAQGLDYVWGVKQARSLWNTATQAWLLPSVEAVAVRC